MSRTRKTVLIKGDPCELRTAVEAADYALVEVIFYNVLSLHAKH